MDDFSLYVIESNGEYYYSLKGQDFKPSNMATTFRSEATAKKMIKNATRLHTDYVERVGRHGYDDLVIKYQLLIQRWKEAKIIKIA